ncbi:MAG: alpha/beta fold hydrolase [Candidatus Binatia bacterium]
MSTFVLIHGAWHGGWCWYKIVPLLTQAGHRVVTPDLPGRGKDKTPLSDISLSRHVEHICAVLDAQPEPVTLVGHSFGGVIITQVAELRPERVKSLVYLTAFLLRDGETLRGALRDATESLLVPNRIPSADGSSTTVREEALKDVFYADCSQADIVLAGALLVPEGSAPMVTPVHTTAANFGRIPRVYIECLRDRAIPATTQRQMYTSLPCQRVVSLDTSHSPFFSAPEKLAAELLSLLT